jgi:hypothetical protein
MTPASVTRTVLYLSIGLIPATLCNSVPVQGQVAGGSILGTVSDPSGAVVANAQITITDRATSVMRTVSSNSAGFYTAPNLAAGEYDLNISVAGFSGGTVSDITITVGAVQTVNVVLKVGGSAATAEVSAILLGVDLVTSGLSQDVDGMTARELPLNGQDWAQLATLQPGIAQVRNQSAIGGVGSVDVVRGARGFGNQLSVSGTRPTQNNYRLDGIKVTCQAD